MEGKEGKSRLKKGFWKPEEDLILKKYVEAHGEGNWTDVSKKSGLKRGAKSCRLRWKNYLRPNIKRGMMSEDEKDLIIRLHKLLGNRWSLIAGRLPGRTDNEVKNYWNTHLNKKACVAQTQKPEEEKVGGDWPINGTHNCGISLDYASLFDNYVSTFMLPILDNLGWTDFDESPMLDSIFM